MRSRLSCALKHQHADSMMLSAWHCVGSLVARTASTRTGKPLLTFRQLAAALGVESEQAAQGRYRRKVGTPNASSSGVDGTP